MRVRFTQTQLSNLFRQSIEIFFQKETNDILSGVAERNLCLRLAIYLEQLMPDFGVDGYYANTEYNRKQNGKIKTILDDNMQIVVINCEPFGIQTVFNRLLIRLKSSIALPSDSNYVQPGDEFAAPPNSTQIKVLTG